MYCAFAHNIYSFTWKILPVSGYFSTTTYDF